MSNSEGSTNKMQKPDWWPKNPYPTDIFPMPEERYAKIVPDPELRTALSGMLGRRFWGIASETIWAAMREAYTLLQLDMRACSSDQRDQRLKTKGKTLKRSQLSLEGV